MKSIEMKWYSCDDCMPPTDTNVVVRYIYYESNIGFYSEASIVIEPGDKKNFQGFYIKYFPKDVRLSSVEVTHWAHELDKDLL